MDEKLKKTIYWGVGIFGVVVIPLFIILAAFDKISIGVSIGVIVSVCIFMALVIAAANLVKTKSLAKDEETEKKNLEPISDIEAKKIIEDRLMEPDFADYLGDVKDEYVAYFGDNKPYPIYIIVAKLKMSRGVLIVGAVNKINKQKSIRIYNRLSMSREQIEREIHSSANLLAERPGVYKFRKVRRIASDGSELEIDEPFEAQKEKEKENEGVLEGKHGG